MTDAEQRVVARYEAFWAARAAANAAPPNPADPALRDLATGEQLTTVVAETEDRRAKGLAVRFPEPSVSTMRIRVRSIDGDRAFLQECSVDDGIIYRQSSGEVLNAEVVTRSAEATMRRVDGVWRVETTRVLQQWKGEAGCALADDF